MPATIALVRTDDDPARRAFTSDDGRLLELIHGEWVTKMPTEYHGTIAALIAYFLLTFVRARAIKAHVGVEVRYEPPGDVYNSRLPDVSLRFSDAPPQSSGAVGGMPDLAVEIQSPDERPHHLRDKALYYLRAGARVVWLIYPQARYAEVCTLADGLAIAPVTDADTLTCPALLPEFALPLRELFPTP